MAFQVEMFPAREGDCILVTYGNPKRRILIDGGRTATYRDLKTHLLGLPENPGHVDLLIVTHVDRDHIEGALALFEDDDPSITVGEVWFNGFHHLNDGAFEEFSGPQGERLTGALFARVEQHGLLWNGSFGPNTKKAAAVAADSSLLEVHLEGDMKLTILSPTRRKMQALIPRWERECIEAGLIAGAIAVGPPKGGFEEFAPIDIDALAASPFKRDTAPPNGASIAVLATHAGKSILLGGDAHEDVLLASLNALREGDRPLRIDAFKVPHHGSQNNLSVALLEAMKCKHYLISTNGSYFHHPDPVAMSRLVKYGGPDHHIWFNYRTEKTEIWNDLAWKADYGYQLHFPSECTPGYNVIDVECLP